MIQDLDYKGVEFLVSKKDFSQIELKHNIFNNMFCYENNLLCPVYTSNEKLIVWCIVDKSHYIYIKYFNRFIFSQARCKNKKSIVASIVYNALVVKEFW